MSKFCGKCGAMVNMYTGKCPNGCDDYISSSDSVTQMIYPVDVPNGPNQVNYVNEPAAPTKKSGKNVSVQMVCLIVAIAVLLISLVFTILYFTVLNKPADDTSDAVTQSVTQSTESSIGFYRALSTSVLDAATVDGVKYFYDPENVLDNDPSTAWVEGAAGSGIGEKITIESDTEQKITGLRISNGYCKSQEIYNRNNRLKEIRITFSDGESITRILKDGYSNRNNVIEFDETVTDSVTIEIISVYRGEIDNDTCISEISVIN